jgi:hypothetical protein
MSLYQHQLFTINLNKVRALYQNEDETTVTIQTDDQRKLEVATESPQAATEFLNEFTDQWEKAAGPLLRYARHVFLPSAIYSIQVDGEELFIYFRDHSVSFALDDAEQAFAALSELTRRWQATLGQEVAG